MADRRAVKPGALGDDLRPYVVWVLVPVRGERAERFKITNGAQPRADLRTVEMPPMFDRPGEMRAPEKRRRNRRKELIVLPVVQLDQSVKAADGDRRRDAGVLPRRRGRVELATK